MSESLVLKNQCQDVKIIQFLINSASSLKRYAVNLQLKLITGGTGLIAAGSVLTVQHLRLEKSGEVGEIQCRAKDAVSTDIDTADFAQFGVNILDLRRDTPWN